jgi:gamma-glutamylcyclotransferase (GGCT)/AIG2-like uncharacterized protein YtfP
MKSGLRIFVYGTLKKGFSNHGRYCSAVSRICPAWRRGKLFKLTGEVPAMTVPDEDILVRGTASTAADIEVQEKFESLLATKGAGGPASLPGPGWGTVRGELLTFDDPERILPLLDDFEEFVPGCQSTYIRALVYVTIPKGLQTAAWTYVAGFDTVSLERYMEEIWDPGRQS